jgi:hypothetical protein
MRRKVALFSVLMLTGLASIQVVAAQEEPNAAAAKALHAAYCIGVLTGDIQEIQKRLNSSRDIEKAQDALRSRLRQFEEFKDRYQAYRVPRAHEPTLAQLDAERKRGEQDFLTVSRMNDRCKTGCPKQPEDPRSGACYSACFWNGPARPMLEDFEVCQHGE